MFRDDSWKCSGYFGILGVVVGSAALTLYYHSDLVILFLKNPVKTWCCVYCLRDGFSLSLSSQWPETRGAQ